MKIVDVKAYSLRTRTAPELDAIFRDPWPLREGTMTIPDRPGLGLTLDEAALAAAIIP